MGSKATTESLWQLKSIATSNSSLSHVEFNTAILKDDSSIDIVAEP